MNIINKNMRKTMSIFSIFAVILLLCPTAFAEETAPVIPDAEPALSTEIQSILPEVPEATAVAPSAEISYEELNVEPITQAPSTARRWWEGLKQFISVSVTVDPMKKAERQLHFANAKMAEAKFHLENAKDRRSHNSAVNAIKKAEKYMTQIKERIDNLKSNENVSAFSDNYSRQLYIHHQLLERFENQLPEQALEKVKAARERHLENMKAVFEKIDQNDQAKIEARLRRVFNEKVDSALQPLENLTFIEVLKAKYPDNYREAYERLINERHEVLAKKMADLAPEKQREVLENFAEAGNVAPKIKAEWIERRHEVLKKIEEQKLLGTALRPLIQELKSGSAQQLEKVIKLEAKKIELKEKASAGDVESEKMLKLIDEREKKVEEKLQAKLKPLPAYDENKFKPPASGDKKPEQPVEKQIPNKAKEGVSPKPADDAKQP